MSDGPSSFEMQAAMGNQNSNAQSAAHSIPNHNGEGWNTPVFQGDLEVIPGIKGNTLDGILSSISGSIEGGIMDSIKHNNAFSQNVAGAFDGTILSQGNLGHAGYDMKLSGDVSMHNISAGVQTNIGDGIDVTKGGGGPQQGGH